jgi:hypothetical protein
MEGIPVSREGSGRRLIRHGMVLFLLGLLTGALIPELTSPRLGIGALCILVACCFVIYGLRRTGESQPGEV